MAVYLLARAPFFGYTGFMEDSVPLKSKNKGGRPRKYQSLDERKASIKAARTAKALAPKEPLPTETAHPSPTQATIAAIVAKLSIPDSVFVTAIAGGMTLTAAYMAAYPNSARASAGGHGSDKAATPKIAAALAQVKEALAAAAEYSFTSFIAEMDRAILFAQQTNNATAYVRAVELKGKACSHLSDRPTTATTGFVLNITGIDAPGLTLEPL